MNVPIFKAEPKDTDGNGDTTKALNHWVNKNTHITKDYIEEPPVYGIPANLTD